MGMKLSGENATQLSRFLIVGTTTVGIDYVTYSLLLFLGASISPSKGIGFITGTVFAYFANRLWTFSAKGGIDRILKFLAVYGINLGVNVGLNKSVLILFGHENGMIVVAFLVATAASATLNFLGMKILVFKA